MCVQGVAAVVRRLDDAGGRDRWGAHRTAEAGIELGLREVEAGGECAQHREPIEGGVVGTKKSDASVRVPLTGRQTAETAATKAKTREQLQVHRTRSREA